MFADTWETVVTLDRLEKAKSELKTYMIEETAKRIVEVTSEFAGDETDFDTAIHEDGPDGDHSLFAVEDEIARIMENRPNLIDVMRDSVEWDTEIFNDDTRRGARALVNESLDDARLAWNEGLGLKIDQ